ncbi:ATP-binding response regulator [Planctomicrobium piriforme]|uniref:Response regulator receiver domain-containing protein n=1 Tax=Planctomicrobium piriforme TaxID=1576369 RepID=A0A1I3ASH7_9PLAN|nr:response regulator [Planctomicrobium piriforme]SFH52726.1 Response regulator receiver domain-containing protein [Planctomicrobium piriforme]
MVKILVVDDSVMDQKIAAGLLQRDTGWEVEFAADGRIAWQRVQDQNKQLPDVIVTDLQMPEMNGLDLVREVQREFPLVPVILMTAQGSETIAVEALQQGASSYVPKSKLASMLTATVQQVLSLAGERRSKRALLRYMNCMDCEFVLSNDTAMLTSLVSYLQGILRDMDVLSENDRLRTGVALEEALLNAAYHGNLEVSSELREIDHMQFYDLARQRAHSAPYMDRRIFIKVKIDAGGLQYVVRDEGPGFDPRTLPDPTDPANIERPCGRGLLLMRTFMDEVTYNDRGNEVTMLKRCARTTMA